MNFLYFLIDYDTEKLPIMLTTTINGRTIYA